MPRKQQIDNQLDRASRILTDAQSLWMDGQDLVVALSDGNFDSAAKHSKSLQQHWNELRTDLDGGLGALSGLKRSLHAGGKRVKRRPLESVSAALLAGIVIGGILRPSR